MVIPALALVAWGCAPDPAVEGPRPPRHIEGWDALVRAADRGDVAAVRALAKDVSLGPVVVDRPEGDAFAGALGFLTIADDEQDVRDGLERARAACAGCHGGRLPNP